MEFIRQVRCSNVILMRLFHGFCCKTARYLSAIFAGTLLSCSVFAATPRYGGTLTTVPGVGLAPPRSYERVQPPVDFVGLRLRGRRSDVSALALDQPPVQD
ncbi:exported protein of unknown function [Acidithiobacillus ferrivorans]|uniref:Uncharacterized protein n=1 Tax=Acidithiobacillus ferrivorans TaxID=160808 RepID=A0A060V0M6_9PROT|nr:exported hypothetical protein [Acidithiobacillus ferrivorans]SMH65038.1 exported protein of unknown function [Acidithiobacillus ferrivorans]